MKTIAGIILMVATIAAGIFFDIYVMLVGGIEEIVKACQKNPLDGSELGWGIAHVLFAGVGVIAAAILCIVWAVIFFGMDWGKKRKGVRGRSDEASLPSRKPW